MFWSLPTPAFMHHSNVSTASLNINPSFFRWCFLGSRAVKDGKCFQWSFRSTGNYPSKGFLPKTIFQLARPIHRTGAGASEIWDKAENVANQLGDSAGPTGRKLSELPRQVFRKLQRDSQEATRRSHTAAAASHSRASPPAESAGTSSSHPAAAPSPAGQAAIRATPDGRTLGIIARAIMPRVLPKNFGVSPLDIHAWKQKI